MVLHGCMSSNILEAMNHSFILFIYFVCSLRQAVNTPKTKYAFFTKWKTWNAAAHCRAAGIVWVRHVKSTLTWCAEAYVRLACVLCSVLCQQLVVELTALVSSNQSPCDIMTLDSHTFHVYLALCGLCACVSASCARFLCSSHQLKNGGAAKNYNFFVCRLDRSCFTNLEPNRG